METAGPVVLGIFIIALGVLNMKGNISSVHWYHRRRVSEEDRRPFGRLIGMGTVLIGAAVILFEMALLASQRWGMVGLLTAGSVILGVGIIAGLGMSFYAMIKYNKGIF